MQKKEIDTCRCDIIDITRVKKVSLDCPDKETIDNLADFFKVMGDKTRLKIISSLVITELCVCDISHILGMSQSAVSHQLIVLKKNGFVKYKRVGKIVYYSLNDEHITTIFNVGLVHLLEQKGL